MEAKEESLTGSCLIGIEQHDESTCPWVHEKPEDSKDSESPKTMDEQSGDEDSAEGVMPKNNGTKLGKNMGGRAKEVVEVKHEKDETIKVGDKSVQVYCLSEKLEKYDLQFAAHHLIPGNESLKASRVVAYLGDSDVIANYASGEPVTLNMVAVASHDDGGEQRLLKKRKERTVESKIVKNGTINYDVNKPENGIWLPSPYALSMKGKWPSEEVKKKLEKEDKRGIESFQEAYAFAAIQKSGGHQFHTRHGNYSAKVRRALDAVALRLKVITREDVCEFAFSDKKERDEYESLDQKDRNKGWKAKKFQPPKKLVDRLDCLSENIKCFLMGPKFRAPMLTDDKIMQKYMNMNRRKRDLDASVECLELKSVF